jgi:dihydroorotate dehydrogenase (fumarate)
MMDLTVKYGSLKLKNPVVAGSSGLTDNTDSLMKLENHGAGAVVLKSLFEEEILREMKSQLSSMSSNGFLYPETLEFYEYFDGPKESTSGYLELIASAKSKLSIPVIASINCVDAINWTYFPEQVEKAGADALELNIFNLPADPTKSAAENEQVYFEIINEVKKQVHIPVFIKISYYSASLASFLLKLSKTKIDGMVLFNKFYNPDIDIEKMELISGAILSSPSDIYQTLRWIAIMSERIDCTLVASTGVHDSEAIVKLLLAGAGAVQIASTLYKNGIPYLEILLKGLEDWMQRKGFSSINEFKGKLSQSKSSNPAAYSRVQFMKYFRGFPPGK